MEEPKVYCIQKPRGKPRDLSSANRYGAIEFVLDDTDAPSQNPSASYHKIHRRLLGFEVNDYIFTAGGDPLAMGLVVAALKELGHREINFLVWERERDIDGTRKHGVGYYVPLRVKLKH